MCASACMMNSNEKSKYENIEKSKKMIKNTEAKFALVKITQQQYHFFRWVLTLGKCFNYNPNCNGGVNFCYFCQLVMMKYQ